MAAAAADFVHGPLPLKEDEVWFLCMSRYAYRPPVSLKVAQFEAAQVGSNSRSWGGINEAGLCGVRSRAKLGPWQLYRTVFCCIELFAYRSIHTYYYHAPNYPTHACMMNCFGWEILWWVHSVESFAGCSCTLQLAMCLEL